MLLANTIAAFPIKKIPVIEGKPTLHTLLHLIKLLCQCSQQIKSGLSPLEYFFAVPPANHYQRFTPTPLALLGPTPQLPVYPPGANASVCENVKLHWQAHKAENNNIKNINEALASLFLAAVQPLYKKTSL